MASKLLGALSRPVGGLSLRQRVYTCLSGGRLTGAVLASRLPVRKLCLALEDNTSLPSYTLSWISDDVRRMSDSQRLSAIAELGQAVHSSEAVKDSRGTMSELIKAGRRLIEEVDEGVVVSSGAMLSLAEVMLPMGSSDAVELRFRLLEQLRTEHGSSLKDEAVILGLSLAMYGWSESRNNEVLAWAEIAEGRLESLSPKLQFFLLKVLSKRSNLPQEVDGFRHTVEKKLCEEHKQLPMIFFREFLYFIGHDNLPSVKDGVTSAFSQLPADDALALWGDLVKRSLPADLAHLCKTAGKNMVATLSFHDTVHLMQRLEGANEDAAMLVCLRLDSLVTDLSAKENEDVVDNILLNVITSLPIGLINYTLQPLCERLLDAVVRNMDAVSVQVMAHVLEAGITLPQTAALKQKLSNMNSDVLKELNFGLLSRLGKVMLASSDFDAGAFIPVVLDALHHIPQLPWHANALADFINAISLINCELSTDTRAVLMKVAQEALKSAPAQDRFRLLTALSRLSISPKREPGSKFELVSEQDFIAEDFVGRMKETDVKEETVRSEVNNLSTFNLFRVVNYMKTECLYCPVLLESICNLFVSSPEDLTLSQLLNLLTAVGKLGFRHTPLLNIVLKRLPASPRKGHLWERIMFCLLFARFNIYRKDHLNSCFDVINSIPVEQSANSILYQRPHLLALHHVVEFEQLHLGISGLDQKHLAFAREVAIEHHRQNKDASVTLAAQQMFPGDHLYGQSQTEMMVPFLEAFRLNEEGLSVPWDKSSKDRIMAPSPLAAPSLMFFAVLMAHSNRYLIGPAPHRFTLLLDIRLRLLRLEGWKVVVINTHEWRSLTSSEQQSYLRSCISEASMQ